MPIVKLTEAFISNGLTCPDKPRIEFCDADLPGLYIEVRNGHPGHGTYYLRYKDATGKTCHQKLGRSTELTLADARKKAKTLKAEIALGADPRGAVKAQKAVITYADFFADHYLPYVKPRKRSWKRDEELFRLRIANVLGHRRLNEITRQQIQTFHSSLLDQGLAPATCDHHIKLIRQSLNLAITWDMLEKNPAAGIKLFNVDNKVEHYMDADELQRLLAVLRANDPPNVCVIATFLLSTGARLNEALQATWSQIDRQNRVWRIPASTSKSKKVRSVPLNNSALDCLDGLELLSTRDTPTKSAMPTKSDYLFVNRLTGKPLTTVHKVWARLRAKAGLPHLRIHDLRHQYASFLVNSGRTLVEIMQILGHSDSKVTLRYSHLSTATLQAAANSASVLIRRSSAIPVQAVEVLEPVLERVPEPMLELAPVLIDVKPTAQAEQRLEPVLESTPVLIDMKPVAQEEQRLEAEPQLQSA